MNEVPDPKKLPGLKEDRLRKLGPCAVCKKPLLEGGELTFYQISISRCIFDPGAVQRRVGLTMMMGNDALARVMGPNEDIAKVFDGPREVVVHESCALEIRHPLDLLGETEPETDDDLPGAAQG